MKVGKNENLIFHDNFLNMDISFDIPQNPLQFQICIQEIKMEGRVSQFLYLGPSLNLRKCRNLCLKKS